jgi:hypothetical protein
MSGRSFHIDPAYRQALAATGLTTFDDFFEFEGGRDLRKAGLAAHRSRRVFELPGGPRLYLKRYVRTPLLSQLRNRFVACADLDRRPAETLARHNIRTPKIVAWGVEKRGPVEVRSFILTEEIPGGSSLEQRLPDCLTDRRPLGRVEERREFLRDLARWVRRFHDTGLRHRDLYLAHIFLDQADRFVLIDLHRCFKPRLFGERWLIKDLAQLYYSAPGRFISRTDRLRFYLDYAGKLRLDALGRRRIGHILRKARRMAARDIRRGRAVPFIDDSGDKA